MELDLVAHSLDGEALLFGEVKWETQTDLHAVRARLQVCAQQFPHTTGKRTILACWMKEGTTHGSSDLTVIRPADVLGVLQ